MSAFSLHQTFLECVGSAVFQMWKFLPLLIVVGAAAERNSAISANYLLKRRCRDAYGDDFEKKWDCIRSGTLRKIFQFV